MLWSLTLPLSVFSAFQCQGRGQLSVCEQWQKPAAQAEGETFTFWRHNLISDVALTTVSPWGLHRLALISSIQDAALPGAQGTGVLRHTKALPNMAYGLPVPLTMKSPKSKHFYLRNFKGRLTSVFREGLLRTNYRSPEGSRLPISTGHCR